MTPSDERRRPAALNFAPSRSSSTDSSNSSLKPPRTPRFAEATSVHSPVDNVRSPFADADRNVTVQAQPGDIGFGYINNRESVAVPMTPMSPLKSALRVPGTPARRLENPLSPTFREEEMLEKRENATDKTQVKDLKVKTRVRMAKFALRGVSLSCSLVILGMLSASFTIFNATKALPAQSNLPSWAPNTAPWPQILILVLASISILGCLVIFAMYCRGGHRRAEKVATYYTLFAIGWFILSMVLWAISAGIFQHQRNNNPNDMWSWSCKENKRSEVFGEKVDYALVCRMQNWVLICIIIEIVVEIIAVLLYSVVFYRYYTKRRLTKSMDLRDRARSDLYLAQLRSQSAPNTPGLKSPGLYSQYTMSPRNPEKTFASLHDIEEQSPNTFTPGARFVEPESAFARGANDAASPSTSAFRLQAPPTKAPSATPRSGPFTPTTDARAPSPPHAATTQGHAPVAADEPTYGAVPIPGAYNDALVKSPPATQTSFGFAR